MKIAVINFSGNVGKTTVARHLLAPRINNAEIIRVETINADDGAENTIKGEHYSELLETFAIIDDAVVDVGASNVEDFMSLMGQFRGSHSEFDFFVVPTVPNDKQQGDTISTIDALAGMGVPKQHIRLIFNKVESGCVIPKVFSSIFNYWTSKKNFVMNTDALIYENELYDRVKAEGRSIADILADDTDYKAKISAATEKEEKLHYARLLGTRRLACGIFEELNAVYSTLFK